MKDDFYKRVKNSLPCNMDEWTDEQLKTQHALAKDREFVKSNIPNQPHESFYQQMIERVADKRGLEL
jgi:hypothetical protein